MTNRDLLGKKTLSSAQRKHLLGLAAQLSNAQTALEAAKRAADVAQANADAFLVYCAEENGVDLGAHGWRFSQEEMAFVQVTDERPTVGRMEKAAEIAPMQNGSG